MTCRTEALTQTCPPLIGSSVCWDSEDKERGACAVGPMTGRPDPRGWQPPIRGGRSGQRRRLRLIYLECRVFR